MSEICSVLAMGPIQELFVFRSCAIIYKLIIVIAGEAGVG